MNARKKKKKNRPKGYLGLLPVLAACAALSCASAPEPNGERGISVEAAARVLRGAASDVETWDTNRDGLLTRQELIGVGSAVAARLVAELAVPPPAPLE
jgi:hypothetical protein